MDKIWKSSIKACLALTFDLDAETFWFSRTMESLKSVNLMAEGRYGPNEGVPRILDMLDRQGVKATFFIPGWVIEHHTGICKEIAARGHEIGYHGYLHEKAIFKEQDIELIEKSKRIMKELLNVIPTGFRCPEADLSRETIALYATQGFTYSSNMMDSDKPYCHQSAGGLSMIELPTNWLYDDTSHFFFTLQQPERRPIAPASHVLEIWKEELYGISQEGGIMTLMLHPQIIGRTSRISMLEKLIAYAKTCDGIYVGCAREISRQVNTERQTNPRKYGIQ